MDRKAVSHLIDALSHPDIEERRLIMDSLVTIGPDVLEVLVANLAFATPKIQMHLIQIIGEIGSPSICIDLMRFVFDYQGKMESNDARALAMKNLVSLAPEEDGARMLKFALDLMQDEDHFVRAGAIQLIGRFGDSRLVGILEDQMKEPLLAEVITSSLAKIRYIEANGQDAQYDEDRILQEIRTGRGGQRSFFIAELKARSNAFEMARTLVQTQGRGMIVGLDVLQSLDDKRGRKVAVEVLLSHTDAATLAIAFRLLAENLEGDANENECELIEKSLRHRDPFVKIAATLAAAGTGKESLIIRALSSMKGMDAPESSKAIAKRISETLVEGSRWVVPHVIISIDELLEKKQDAQNQNKLTVAYLLRALRFAIQRQGVGARDAHKIIFRALKFGSGFPQIVIASLELLSKLAPSDGYKFSPSWTEEETLVFSDILHDLPERLRSQTLKLLFLGAPAGIESLSAVLRPLAFGQGEDVSRYVIPLLSETGASVAKEIISELSKDPNKKIREAANAALRRDRNAKDWIDAEFE